MKKKHLSEEILPWTLTEASAVRHLREGACTILTVKACYPVLTQNDHSTAASIMATAEAASRFNACYADAAEAFVQGGLSVVGSEVKALFDAVGAESRSLFLRRELSCHMTLRRENEQGNGGSRCHRRVKLEVGEGQRSEFLVEVDRLYCTRRSRNADRVTSGIHHWSFPWGVMEI